MMRAAERGAEESFLRFWAFLWTLRGAVWLALVLIAGFLVAEPDDGEVTSHTHFLLVCFAVLALVPDFKKY